MSETPRRQRWDAARNRARLLAVAREVFAAKGLSADVREVARRADVGIATLYRHFPTKDDLVLATVEKDLAEWAEAIEIATATEDAWFGLTLLIEQTLAVMARHRAVLEGLSYPATAPAGFAHRLETLHRMLDGLVDRAHRQGTLRLDVSSVDVGLLIFALGRIVQLTVAGTDGRVPGSADDAALPSVEGARSVGAGSKAGIGRTDAANAVWRRHTGLVLDGLHTHAVRA
ncbi:TetR/AcrR family transcriptional regulator [Actinoalloteichus hymeniacidonis]|uniref:Transcriptional regulator, TetR family n=1 Tax=Actinoalloteichus hymeniacidonis TaxID=340345 RepID=A0AAC9HQR8_9PSEU|nr:TetR/AcrR family transcriptional regulator [Actinoalloteichus hymeniacidonis]AOS63608.1 transcriptional regulator, TetR family [Actinoalloteichus hymeniacidonis]MBB5908344.1 AcrR family transcriptional regulator [Actinoalloteichus hymeniacidonis]